MCVVKAENGDFSLEKGKVSGFSPDNEILHLLIEIPINQAQGNLSLSTQYC